MEFIGIIFIALLVGLLFSFGFKSHGPWNSFWVFLLFLIFAGWIARLWITPVGPMVYGFAWMPVLFFVLFIAILIGASTPRNHYRSRGIKAESAEAEKEVRESRPGAVFGLFFWFLWLFFLIAIIGGLLD